ncbi:MAG: hypothetical protein R3Y13_01740 [bacterium]
MYKEELKRMNIGMDSIPSASELEKSIASIISNEEYKLLEEKEKYAIQLNSIESELIKIQAEKESLIEKEKLLLEKEGIIKTEALLLNAPDVLFTRMRTSIIALLDKKEPVLTEENNIKPSEVISGADEDFDISLLFESSPAEDEDTLPLRAGVPLPEPFKFTQENEYTKRRN